MASTSDHSDPDRCQSSARAEDDSIIDGGVALAESFCEEWPSSNADPTGLDGFEEEQVTEADEQLVDICWRNFSKDGHDDILEVNQLDLDILMKIKVFLNWVSVLSQYIYIYIYIGFDLMLGPNCVVSPAARGRRGGGVQAA